MINVGQKIVEVDRFGIMRKYCRFCLSEPGYHNDKRICMSCDNPTNHGRWGDCTKDNCPFVKEFLKSKK